MKLSYYSLFISILPLILFHSCTNQNKLKQDKEIVKIEEQPLILKEETGQDLRFTRAVRSILEDSKGNYWFGSWNEGVAMFDGKKMTYLTEKDGLSNNQVRTIQEDLNGNIWFATGEGISSYDGKKITNHIQQYGISPITFLETEWKNSPNDLWFNLERTRNQQAKEGLARYDNHQLSFVAFPPEVRQKSICESNITITGISRGKDNRIWFSNYCGVFGFDGKQFTIIEKEDYIFHVRAILEDSKGNLWIGNNGNGVLMYDGDSVINFSKQHGVDNPVYLTKQQLSDNPNLLARVFSIGEDIDGNIWFGTYEAGLWKYDGEELTHYTTIHGLTSMSIMEIYTDKKGKTWFGMGDGSVCQFNGIGFNKVF